MVNDELYPEHERFLKELIKISEGRHKILYKPLYAMNLFIRKLKHEETHDILWGSYENPKKLELILEYKHIKLSLNNSIKEYFKFKKGVEKDGS